METKELYTIWKTVFTNDTDENIPQCFNKIIQEYQGKYRHYHSLEHVADLLRQIEQLDVRPQQRRMLILAAFFHDVIYKAGSTTNEIESSVFANIWMNRLPLEYQIIHPVCEMIEATATHESENELCQLFLDIDLQVLAAKNEKYDKYTNEIRKEHMHLPNFYYKAGRKKFIREMLCKPRIFLTKQYHKKYEQLARINLFRELHTL